jgi:Heterokaryon incompatibility protein (HET)
LKAVSCTPPHLAKAQAIDKPVKRQFPFLPTSEHVVEISNTVSQASASQQTIYQPLIHEDSIRLLRIHPAIEEEPIVCSLEHTVFGVNKHYYALSYTWGPPSPTDNVVIEGRKFEVRANLYSALLRFRSPDSSVYLWIDALCLNQDDIQERSCQVKGMRRIYENSVLTLIWLGDHLESDIMALELFQWVQDDAIHVQDSRRSLTLAIAEKLRHPLMRKSLLSILSKSWFNRAWVQQEFAVSKSTAFICGSYSFAISTTNLVVEAITLAKPQIDLPLWNQMARISPLLTLRDRHGYQQGSVLQTSISWLLGSTFTNLEATDPRDHVYSLLGLVSDQERDRIVVNYDLSVADVFTQCMSYCLSSEKNIVNAFVLLSDVGAFPPGRYRACLPSWVPDFSSSFAQRILLEAGTIFSAT